jgi:hypothetical protein
MSIKRTESKASASKFEEVGVIFAGKKDPQMLSLTTDLEVTGTEYRIQFTAWPIDTNAIVERKMPAANDKDKAAYKATLPLYRVYASKELLSAMDNDDVVQTKELKAQGEIA